MKLVGIAPPVLELIGNPTMKFGAGVPLEFAPAKTRPTLSKVIRSRSTEVVPPPTSTMAAEADVRPPSEITAVVMSVFS